MATPVRTPQNANNVLILLGAIDSNLGKYTTVESQNDFLDSLVTKYDFNWEGKGKWGDSHETLRRVLNRLAQDRRPEFRDLTGDDKLHDRVHALFRFGSDILSTERLRAYGYSRRSDRSGADGKRKRVETEAGREYRRSSNAGRRRHGTSEDRGDSESYPVQKRPRTSAEDNERSTRSSNGVKHSEARRMSLQEDLPRTRRYTTGRKASSVEAGGNRRELRSPPQQYADESDNGEGSSEYEDAMQYDPDRTRPERKASPQRPIYSSRNGRADNHLKFGQHTQQNGNGRNHPREPSPNPWHTNGTPNVAVDAWSKGGQFRIVEAPSQNTTRQDLSLSDRLTEIHHKVTQLASFFYPQSSNPNLPSAPLLHASPPPALADLYYSIFGSESKDWHRVAGPLLEHRALSARTFLIALIWAFLRKNFLDTDTTGFHRAPLWSLLDERNLTHRWAKGYYQSGVNAAAAGQAGEYEETGPLPPQRADSAAWPLMRDFFRKVALTQLHEDRRFMKSFLRPTAWDKAFELHGILHLHDTTRRPSENSAATAAFYASAEKYSQQTTLQDSDDNLSNTLRPLAHHPDIPQFCKEICLAALVLRASVQICTEKFEWVWVESEMEMDAARMLPVDDGALRAVQGETSEEVAVGVMPGLRWIMPAYSVDDEDEVIGEEGNGEFGDADMSNRHTTRRSQQQRPQQWNFVPAKVVLMPL
ncbi:uncharacterized protein K489DRAFT_383236 [Dissoconium aciculare CBS 342.82]|uniref:Uncharacterized protein n=1 Tax=Dissoconium aciculare CBS 342.82 TaxID=1314786 RepID=A0A6J3LXM7_9PEZI|nr:uncharacterized protein K489DRAFT_383236 [Dissoconium aciculare CBS 342.82]KAF1820428.1 hypothetical protein K489DRAFT_383236 [Dissoconium aciculare CBS 342.82]